MSETDPSRASDQADPAAGGPPAFDRPVVAGGYQWWYLDALDPEARQGVVVIAFVGSVFSPYYYRARGRGRGRPEDFCAINVGLYQRRGKAWCMTERQAGSVLRGPEQLRIGPSSLSWMDGELVIDVRERRMPFGQRLLGRIRARPLLRSGLELALDDSGRHHWMPWAPLASVQVELTEPAVSWRGQGYLDGNRGDEPLEHAFTGWNWSRIEQAGTVDIQYDLSARDGSQKVLAMRFAADGCSRTAAANRQALPATGWRLTRQARAEGQLKLARTLEDTPFYARSLLTVERETGPARGVHEALCLERFRRTWVRSLLPFRMPREWRPSGF